MHGGWAFDGRARWVVDWPGQGRTRRVEFEVASIEVVGTRPRGLGLGSFSSCRSNVCAADSCLD